MISFNGGGNDMLRPRMPEERVADRFRQAVHRIRGAGIHVLMLSGANPTDHLPSGACSTHAECASPPRSATSPSSTA